jgi:outer membrane protein TolC
VLGCLLVAGVARAAESPPLTLENALHLAMAKNERAQKAPLRVETAVGNLDKARTAFFPSIIAGGSGAWNSTSTRDKGLSAFGTITLNQPLFNASSIYLYGQARHNEAAERWGAAEDLRVLAFDTTNAFLTVLADEQLLAAAQKRLERAKSDHDDTSVRATSGLTSTNDVTRASVAMATAESQVANAKAAVDRAYLQLGFLVGQPVKGPLVAPERTTNNARKGDWQMDEVVKRAEARRPDLKSAIEHTESLRDFAKEPLARIAPTLSLTALVRQTIDPLPTDQATTETAQLTLTWVLYDAGSRYADRRLRLAQAESGSLDEQLLRRSVATDIATAIASLHAARDVFKISVQAVIDSQKNVEETAFLYQQGLAKAIEVTDANATRYDAEVTMASAKLSMEQAYLNLRYALGLGPVADELPDPVNPTGAGK